MASPAASSVWLRGSGVMDVLHVSKSVGEFSYHESIVRELCARGHTVEALFDQGYSAGASDAAARDFAAGVEGFSMGWSIRPGSWRRPASGALLALATLGSYLTRTDQSSFYRDRFEAVLPPPLRRLVRWAPVRALLRRPGIAGWLRRLSERVPPDPAILRWLAARSPDVVIASPANMRFTYESEYLRAAKRLGIPTVVPVFSWDNLTTKGLFPVIPDRMLVWNRTHLEEASRIHGVPAERMVLTGAPLFDRWDAARLGGRTREEFCRRVGLDPSRPFVCYLGSTAGIAQDESWVVRELAGALREHELPEVRETSLLMRPHPLHTAAYLGLEDERVRVWPKGGGLPDSREALRDFYDTLRFSVAAIGINTTGMLDAVIVDRPCIAILAERYAKTQAEAVHFGHLRKAGVLEEAHGTAECLTIVARLLAGGDGKLAERRRFVHEFIRPLGRRDPAGAAAATAVEELVASAPRARATGTKETVLQSRGIEMSVEVAERA